jgi:hypothetical protein
VIAMTFGVILFQPSAKYRQNNFIGDVTVEVAYAIIFFNSLEYTDKLSPSITTSIIIKKIYFLKNSIEQKNQKNQKIKIV